MRTYSFLIDHATDPHKFHVKWTLDNGIITGRSEFSCDEAGLLNPKGKVDGRVGHLHFLTVVPAGMTVLMLATPPGFVGWDDCPVGSSGAVTAINFKSGFSAAGTGWRWTLIGRWD